MSAEHPYVPAGASTGRDLRARFSHVPLDRVLVVMLAAVGDAVHALPVINAIKRLHPKAFGFSVQKM